jgi:hypothetical protein
MRIAKIANEGNVYELTRYPNFIERFFGIKTRTDVYEDTGDSYSYGGRIYVDQKGIKIRNGSEVQQIIEYWRRRL